MKIICYYCEEDIDEKNQDNMSEEIGYPKCEDCHQDINEFINLITQKL